MAILIHAILLQSVTRVVGTSVTYVPGLKCYPCPRLHSGGAFAASPPMPVWQTLPPFLDSPPLRVTLEVCLNRLGRSGLLGF